jgi:hypothetical protein
MDQEVLTIHEGEDGRSLCSESKVVIKIIDNKG